uniref:Uncharacterized protein n=1 Tax=Arion vulgaris TaxID=1028688 RepID=A0A0B6YDY4_9EUPU
MNRRILLLCRELTLMYNLESRGSSYCEDYVLSFHTKISVFVSTSRQKHIHSDLCPQGR